MLLGPIVDVDGIFNVEELTKSDLRILDGVIENPSLIYVDVSLNEAG